MNKPIWSNSYQIDSKLNIDIGHNHFLNFSTDNRLEMNRFCTVNSNYPLAHICEMLLANPPLAH